MSFAEQLELEANYTKTLNGARTHGTTGEAVLDLFSVAGAMRYRDPKDQIRLFDRAYIEDPELAVKLLFYIRDIREGMGERQVFRNLLRHLAFTWPESAGKNVHLIAEYGRYDDLLCLTGTPAWKQAAAVIKEQLQKDLDALEQRKNGDKDAPISLLAKWLPSANTSSYKTRRDARCLIRALGMDERSYRKMLSALRANTGITERYLSKGQDERIRYEAVPAGAMLKYRKTFVKKDGFSEYLKDVSEGQKKIHADNLFPYQIIRPYLDGYHFGIKAVKAAEDQLLEYLWTNLPDSVGNENAISVIDTSGSMYFKWRPDAITPALISQSLGLYHAEHCKGVFHNKFITFESVPHLIEIHGENLADKLRYISNANWGGSTNLEAVFELILTTAVNADASQEEMPSVLYIISDMEFNQAVRNPDKTVYDNARDLFEEFGYELPAVVFINVNSWQMQAPVRADTKGAALMSGAGTSAFRHKFDGNMTPMSNMLRILNGKRYKDVHA